ncbi:hypothetical protein CORC01_00281 [Colletotrichum orchidophilum]|uniref:Uncharacterized protein n=1 Tax=Colletotrichum orchidophilum TaxID=1209926 RepID=A0A1G4BSP2_9PEZI|nr:uncharacterized protein CORC01_00281 [Colletotrichum orchidophilum]OHF04429.1 hypothetical protein CORC01_00281 [Colletotrichum orchidophilum]
MLLPILAESYPPVGAKLDVRRPGVGHAARTDTLAPKLLSQGIVKCRNVPDILPANSELAVQRVNAEDAVDVGVADVEEGGGL